MIIIHLLCLKDLFELTFPALGQKGLNALCHLFQVHTKNNCQFLALPVRRQNRSLLLTDCVVCYRTMLEIWIMATTRPSASTQSPKTGTALMMTRSPRSQTLQCRLTQLTSSSTSPKATDNLLVLKMNTE